MKIEQFVEEYAFLSNFYECPVYYDGIWYRNSEAAFQSAKTTDKTIRQAFAELSASRAKYLGRRVELRSDWEEIKDEVMYEIVLNKFTVNTQLGEKLINTGDVELIEGNTWNDYYWGICRGMGENKLGKILMQVRENIKEI